MQIERWNQLPLDAKTQIKSVALEALSSSDERVGRSAAQLIAAIADIELPLNAWPDLMQVLIANTAPQNPSEVKKSALLAIGYICETADSSNPGVVAQASPILTAIVQGAQSSETDPSVRLTAINALVNSLEFIRGNFGVDSERNYIMQVVCEATQSEDNEVQVAAFGAMARIMSLYYQYMSFYMEKALFSLTVSGMRSENDRVACMAVEFWSTVCEEELEILMTSEDEHAAKQNYQFAQSALPEVLPTLLSLLTRQDELADEDDWNVSMAAGACLQLYAQTTQNAVVPTTLNFVEVNLADEDWKKREAAVMAFGSILDGPDYEELKALIGQALNPIVSLINDQSLHVRDTVAWCLGRMADLVIDGISIESHLPSIIHAIVVGLNDDQKVAANCCWTIMNLTEQLNHDGPQEDTAPMSQYYNPLVTALLSLATKQDNDASARASAYEALSTLVIFSANDVLDTVRELATQVMQRLEGTLGIQQQVVGIEDRASLEELQINLLSLLTNIVRRIGEEIPAAADRLMELFFNMLTHKLPNTLIEEDIFIAIGAVAGVIGPEFEKYMETFLPFLVAALQDPDAPAVRTAIGLVADISHALGPAVAKYSENMMTILGSMLQAASTPRDIKPMILSCFGDIASSMGSSFSVYLDVVMAVIREASQLQTTVESPPDFLEYVSSLREAIVDAYVGIVTGLHDEPGQLYPHLGSIMEFLQLLNADVRVVKTESTVRSVVGLLGDIATMYPAGSLVEIYSTPWVTETIKKARTDRTYGNNTRDTAKWAREQQKLHIAGAP